jgi:beta-glucosidase
MLLRDHLRNDWHFDGYVVSDCGAVADIDTGHHYAPDMAHAAADALKAGTDLECGYGQGQAFAALVDAVHQNLVTEVDLDQALRRLFRARFDLGMFDPPASYSFGRIPATENNSPEHRALALQAARESMVLLKNKDGALPLKPNVKRIAVIGPTAELVQSLQGNYNAPPPNPVYPITGIEKRFRSATVSYAQGSTLVAGVAMPIEHTALSPATGAGHGLSAEYFNSADLSGQPVLTRTDANINFNWDKVVPVAGLGRNNYSVRWSGNFTPPAPGDYKLGVRMNYCYSCENTEGFRLFLDGKLLVAGGDKPTGERGAVIEAPVHFADAQPHAIRLEYLHGTGSAGIDLTWQAPAAVLRDEAVNRATNADVVIALVGLSPSLEGEEMPIKLEGFDGGDRTAIDLPADQENLLKALAGTGKPLIVVLQNGSALAVNWANEHADAVLEAWYPGEEGGTAIAETLAGDNNPAGRLPVTFYADTKDLPPFDDYSMNNRTYRYFHGTPLWGFGYGLSYSNFEWTNLKLSTKSLDAGSSLIVDADVENVSGPTGDAVSELYLTPPAAPTSPQLALVGFQRTTLAPHAKQHVRFILDARALSTVDANGVRAVRAGDYTLNLGGSQPAESSDKPVAGSFSIRNNKELPR